MLKVNGFRQKNIVELKKELISVYKERQDKVIMYRLGKEVKLSEIKLLKYKVALINTLIKEKEILNVG